MLGNFLSSNNKMAEEALKKLEEQLNCSICLDTFTDPKLLQCFHVYCRQCLVRLVVRDQQGKLGLTCPTCRQVTPIPDNGVTGLQPAFHINRMLEIYESLRKVESAAVSEHGADKGPTREIRHCKDHPEEKLKLYCETCGELVCYICGLKSGKHRDHDYQELDLAFQRYKEEIAASFEPMEEQVATVEEALAQLNAHCEEISDQRATSADSIHVSFRRLHEVLNVRETELIDQLDRMTQEKLKCLATHRDQIETTLAQLNSCLHFMRKTSSEEDVLMMKANTVCRIEELTTSLKPGILRSSAKPDIKFSVPRGFTASCKEYGTVFLDETIMLKKKLDAVTDQLEDQGVQPGRFNKKIGITTLTIGGLKKPWGVAVSKHKEIVITECDGDCVSVFAHSGEKLRSFGTSGYGAGQFHGPRGVAVDSEGSILVADSWNHRIQKFTAEGRFIASFGTEGSGLQQLSYPTSVTVNPKNRNVYIVDNDNYRVTILNPDFSHLGTFGEAGVNEGQFSCPLGVTCDSTGKVYVTDNGNNRVQVFSAKGKFLRMIGRCGEGRGELAWPSGIAVDVKGIIYVSSECNIVSVFTSEDMFMTSFGRSGKKEGQFNNPCGLAVDVSGTLYVCDSDNDRLLVF